jgi:hypothetical protein
MLTCYLATVTYGEPQLVSPSHRGGLVVGDVPRSEIARLRPELNEFITGLARSLRP